MAAQKYPTPKLDVLRSKLQARGRATPKLDAAITKIGAMSPEQRAAAKASPAFQKKKAVFTQKHPKLASALAKHSR